MMAFLPQLTLCLLAAALCILQTQGNNGSLQDCCYATSAIPFPVNQAYRLRSYHIQRPQMECQLPAVVFITKKGRKLCFPPNDDRARELMEIIDARKKRKQQQQQRKQQTRP